MAPVIPSASCRVSYPLYACDFDPQDANRLVVGGGGGPGRSGVSNKISVLDASHQDVLSVVSEVDLSRDEDSVSSLAVGPRRRNSILVFTGINSSPADVAKGKNEHFRVFSVDQPSKTKATPKIAELSRSSLFTTQGGETYQRLLRISPAYPDRPQLGVVATGFAKQPQIAIFDIPAGGAAPKPRGVLEIEKEATDLDLIQTGDDQWQLVYCDDFEVHTVNISKTGTSKPACVFTMPQDEVPRPTFRSIRYLTPTFVLTATNIPKAGGVALQGLRLPKPEQGSEAKARVAVSAKLTKSVTRATGMAVRNLSPPASPSAKQGDTQFVIAVSGQDSSVTLYTLEHQVMGNVELVANLYPITTLKGVHAGPISGLAFSHFVPPKSATMRVLHLKLASIGSMGNSCVVHALPLKRFIDKSSATARRAGPPRVPRYVVALKSHGPSPTALIAVLTVVVLIMAFAAQSFLEVKGFSPSIIGARRVVPAGWRETHWKNAGDAPIVGSNAPLADILADSKDKLGAGDKVVVLDADPDSDQVSVEQHDSEQHGPAREWHELPSAEKAAWKEKLKKAGHWAEGQGESILKGVLFGQIGGVVGAMVNEM